MKNYNFLNSMEVTSYMDACGKLHLSWCARDLIEKTKSKGHRMGDFKMDGHFSGAMNASDL